MVGVFNKVDPNEIINVGDLIMLDSATGKVTVTQANSYEELEVNQMLVVGVCSESDNTTPLPQILDCGQSIIDETRLVTLDLGDSTTETGHVLTCENSEPNSREYIEINNTGSVILENDGANEIEIGTKVRMSGERNKVTGNEFNSREATHFRTIGKVTKILSDNKVEVLLDIE